MAEQPRPILAVELEGVHRSFGAVRAVDGVDLHLELGEIAALLGPNGAGKTTTIDIILGLGKPDRGTVRVLGMAPDAAVGRGLVSAVLQTGGLLKDLTVGETVRLTATLFSDPRPVAEVLERAGIATIADRLVGKCSGGQQQRLRFALALLPDPALMVLDEPTSGMDVEGRHDFWSAIRNDAEQGRTVLFATHYLEEADAYADRIIFLRQGRIAADGTGAEVRSLSSGRSVRATLPGADEASLRGLPGVRSVEIRGERVIVQTTESDVVARFLYLELRRLVRNRRTVLLTLVVPIGLFLLFRSAKRLQAGGPTGAASTMIGVAVYGAMLAATSGGALVSVERAVGWSRQLRLTPLRPPAYIVIKLLVAMLLGLVSVGVVYVAGAIDGIQMAPGTWLLTGVLAWGTALVFAAFGLFLGYLLPTENAMQFIGPVLGVFALVGGLFAPLKLLPAAVQDIAPYMPPYGVAQIARFPLLGGTFDFTWILSVVLWSGTFGVGAMFLFRRDIRRT